MSGRYLLAIPVLNEERYLPGVLSQARRYMDDILVIDDGSTDATPQLLRRAQGVAVLRHDRNRGYGASVADAFAYAAQAGYDWLLTMDCDEQHEPSFIPKFVAASRSKAADIVSGSRYLASFGGSSVPPADRRRINRRITRMLNNELGLDITDAFCGFKAYRVSSLGRLHITVPGYAMPLQLWVQAWRAGLRVTELAVPLIYNDPSRQFGGALDDAAARYKHYIEVYAAEMASGPTAAAAAAAATADSKCGASAA